MDIFEKAFTETDPAIKSTGSASGAETTEAVKPAEVTYEDFDYNKLNVYAGIDCITTLELLKVQIPQVVTPTVIVKPDKTVTHDEPIINAFHSIVLPSQEFIIDLEINGMGYSVPRNEWLSRKMVQQVAELDEKIFSQIGKPLDLNSGKKVGDFLYGEKGLEPPSFTKSGAPATDGQTLKILAGLDPFATVYQAKDPAKQYLADMALRRDVSSVHNTFIKTYVRDFVKRDGRLHPSYNQFGTGSFRITGSDPNLTQLPRSKHGYNIRVCYTVRDRYVFISFDFSSAEVKVLANIAKEPAMLKAIAEGMDFHSFSASSMEGIPYKEFIAVLEDKSSQKAKEYKEKRQRAKILTFSIYIGTCVW